MEKNNIGYKVILTILIIAVIGLVLYIVYDKMNTDKTVNNDNNTQQNISDNNNQTIDANDCSNIYNDFANNLIKNRNQTIYRVDAVLVNEHLGIDSIILEQNGNVNLNFNDSSLKSKYGENYVLNKNVLSVSLLEYGNGGLRTIIMIKEDGSIDAIDSKQLVNDKQAVLKQNVGNVKDIVDVVQISSGNVMGINAIDIYGNTHFIEFN